MRQAIAWALVLLAAATAIALGGSAPYGRLALAIGLPAAAARLLEEPLWQGLALYRLGRYEAAAEAFRVAGPPASFNRGNALALAGRYKEAVEAYDAVLFRTPADAEARANRALVAVLVPPAGDELLPHGTEPPSGTPTGAPDGQSSDDGKPVPNVLSHDEVVALMRKLYVGKPFTDQSVVASREWLATLADEPGRFLKLRLMAERARRFELGLGMPPGDDPW